MDTFFEQIVSIKKSGKAIALFLFVWILALILCALILLFGIPFAPVLVIGLGYGAWWLTAKLNVEYEYIVTNGTMDIDKIVNKSSRQRVSSFEIAKVERVEKYNPSLLNLEFHSPESQ